MRAFSCVFQISSKFIFVFDLKYGSRFTFPSGTYIQSAGWEGRGCPVHTVAPGAVTPSGPLPHPLLLPREAWAAHSPAPPPRVCSGSQGPARWGLPAEAGGRERRRSCPANLPPATRGYSPTEGPL